MFEEEQEKIELSNSDNKMKSSDLMTEHPVPTKSFYGGNSFSLGKKSNVCNRAAPVPSRTFPSKAKAKLPNTQNKKMKTAPIKSSKLSGMLSGNKKPVTKTNINAQTCGGSGVVTVTKPGRFFQNRSPRKRAVLAGRMASMLKSKQLPLVTQPKNSEKNNLGMKENQTTGQVEATVTEDMDSSDELNVSSTFEVHESCPNPVTEASENSINPSSTDLTSSPLRPSNRVFPIFSESARLELRPKLEKSPKSPASAVLKSPKSAVQCLKGKDKMKKEQMILDFGQKMIGAIQCSVCGMTYTHSEPTDELMHSKFHKQLLAALRFTGWQKERVIQDYLDGSRIIMVLPEDKTAMKRVEAIKNIADADLGFVVDGPIKTQFKTFLYIIEKQVIGFCLVQPITMGYRMLEDSQSASQTSQPDRKRPYCCSNDSEPVRCGINRIWVLASERKKRVATKLLDAVRGQFLLGYPLSKIDIAFSDPTPDGIKFATKYTGTPCFFVYRN